MMDFLVDLASWALILAGSFFTVVGAIGLVRMPDVYTRVHAGSLIDSLGVGLLIVGLALQAGFGLVTLKLLVLLGAIFFTWPVATHALVRVCLHEDIKPLLAEDRRETARQAAKLADEGRAPSS